ncbi:DUF2845 domain-containing protein [Neptuniibacter caesariensis]|uniref:PepSY domain-containing protein n=1 Tax=Neptuniibacter caesariensis TaxID=207954 RepID=A0A7U8GSD1_NEPCE|nr:DUF2845 domain-containing protein [Neptuniibacter caesariensis]EAR62367.1 hypothetical protein MED92_15058 [Oceanospirillum sp. MED92] [Neptuniibacter caesariensis]
MKYLTFGLLLMASAAQATFLYAPDGSRISEGDSIAKVVEKMGQPLTKSQQQTCIKFKAEYCTQWVQFELWQYVAKGYYWRLDIREGKVHSLEWSLN